MRVAVTGAAGFVGRAVVDRALAAGHEVTAIVRPRTDLGRSPLPAAVSVVRGDLRLPGTWTGALDGPDPLDALDAVVHAAAAPGGDRARQLADTVVATERFLAALEASPPRRFVHVSSFSVYDFHAPRVGARLDEDAPLERHPERRDPYTEAKLVQERLVREWCGRHDVTAAIVRPGAVVGPGHAWDHGAALRVGRLAFVVAPRARFRLVSVANCADAIVRAIDAPLDGIETFDVVDDDLPTNAEYFRRCRAASGGDAVLVPVPWRALDALGRAIDGVSVRFLDGRLRTPELLDHRRQEARWKPLEYSNDRAHRRLGWRPAQGLDDTVATAVGGSA